MSISYIFFIKYSNKYGYYYFLWNIFLMSFFEKNKCENPFSINFLDNLSLNQALIWLDMDQPRGGPARAGPRCLRAQAGLISSGPVRSSFGKFRFRRSWNFRTRKSLSPGKFWGIKAWISLIQRLTDPEARNWSRNFWGVGTRSRSKNFGNPEHRGRNCYCKFWYIFTLPLPHHLLNFLRFSLLI